MKLRQVALGALKTKKSAATCLLYNRHSAGKLSWLEMRYAPGKEKDSYTTKT